MRSLILSLFILTISSKAFSKIDRREDVDGISMQSGKEDGVRTYQASWVKKFAYSLQTVKSSITNFPERCNNEHKDKRKFTDKNHDCRYMNEHMVESFILTDLKNSVPKLPGETERMLVGRQIYNRGKYGYYELVQVIEGLNNEGKKMVTILEQMLNDDEVKKLTEPNFSQESAFDKSFNKYTLVEISANETQVTYEFEAQTDHWVLNKEVSVPQVFASISKSINDLIKAVNAESARLTQEITAKK